MSTNRSQKTQRTTAISIVALALALLSVIGVLATSAAAGPSTQSAQFASTHGVDPALARALTNLSPERLAARHARRAARRASASASATAAPTTAPAPSTSAAPTTSAPSSAPASTSAGSAPSSPAPTSTTPPANPLGSLVWSDEFDGAAGTAANPAHWNSQTGGRWGNHEMECYTDDRSNSAEDGAGNLVITARYTPGHICSDGASNTFTSARLSSEHLATLEYGKVRVRAILPSASGIWPAIWGLGDDTDTIGWPQAGEIDMVEAVGQTPNMVYGTVHGPTASGAPYGIGNGYQLSAPVNSGYHVYGLDWTPTSIAISIDDHVYRTVTKADVTAAGGQWVFDRPFNLILNVAVGGDWPGTPQNMSAFPQAMKVDYVRVYQ